MLIADQTGTEQVQRFKIVTSTSTFLARPGNHVGDIRKRIRNDCICAVKVDDSPIGLVNEIASHDIVRSRAVEADACATIDRCEQEVVFDYVAAATHNKRTTRQ